MSVQREDAQLTRFVKAIGPTMGAHLEQLWASAASDVHGHYKMLSVEDAKRYTFQVGENRRAKSREAYAMWRQMSLLRSGRGTIALGRDLMSSLNILSQCEQQHRNATLRMDTVKAHSIVPAKLVREAQDARKLAIKLFDHACDTHQVLAARTLHPVKRPVSADGAFSDDAALAQWHAQTLEELRIAARVSYDIQQPSNELEADVAVKVEAAVSTGFNRRVLANAASARAVATAAAEASRDVATDAMDYEGYDGAHENYERGPQYGGDMKSDDGDGELRSKSGETSSVERGDSALATATQQTVSYNQSLATILGGLKEQVGHCKRQYIAASERVKRTSADFEPHQFKISGAKRELHDAESRYEQATLASSTYLLSELPDPVFRNAMGFLCQG
jgi:hypothetical protein